MQIILTSLQALRAALAALCMLVAFCSGSALAEPASAATLQYSEGDGFIDVSESGTPVLRYHHGATAVPGGLGPEFARGDYVSALYGLDGQLLTEDYPKDHPHHRAVNWAWATIRWHGEDRDLFAVRGIWARPVGKPRVTTEESAASITAENVWKWDDKTPVVSEAVSIRVFSRNGLGRIIDFEITLTALVEGLEFCGRLDAGYSGFNIRMAPAKGQEIIFHTDPPEARPQRAWADYSAMFSGGNARAGLAILQHAGNPLYPQEWRKYPDLNFFQPLYPGGKLVPMPRDKPILLRYRLWIHNGAAEDAAAARQWDQYNQAPKQ